MITRKIKFDKVSKPSQLAKDCNGSGKIATIINMIGNNNQVMELRMESLLFARLKIIIISRARAAITISICRVLIF